MPCIQLGISRAIAGEPIIFQRLHPPGAPAGLEQVIDGLALGHSSRARAAERPYVALNMTSTLDGRASIGGRSGAISDAADRALFHGLRSVVDAVAVGGSTVSAERYGPMIADPAVRERRLARGLSEQPLACIVTSDLQLQPDLPLLADPNSRVALLTAADGTLAGARAALEYVRAPGGEHVDLQVALRELYQRLEIRVLLCEGGPRLGGALLAGGLVDELFLSLAPKLAGDPADGELLLRIVAGAQFDPPLELELAELLAHQSRLFLRLRVRS